MLSGIRGIHHVSLTVSDLEAVMRFYCDVFGFKKIAGLNLPEDYERASDEDRGGVSVEQMMAQAKKTVQVNGDEPLHASIAMLQLGDSYIELFEYKQPKALVDAQWRPPYQCGISHFALDVVDLEGLYPKLMAAGITFHAPPQHNKHVITTYGRDPWGNIIEFQEIKKDLHSPG
jgi:catechol 2,3-dioxygenase-like lactoylglutathione lyase family enzyme